MSSSFIIEEWRDLWSRKSEFIIVALAFVFQTTNMFTLPSLIVNHGGGAFMIAYVACILFICLGIIMMELAIGQLSARAPPKALHSACPLFKGVGVALVVYSLALLSFYAVRVVYLLNYLVHMYLNVYEDPPWFHCPDTDVACRALTTLNETKLDDNDILSVSYFHNRTVLNKTESIEIPGELIWMLIAGLAIVWFCVFLALFLGVRWLGKVCFFTFFIPLLLLLGLMVKGLASDGADVILKAMILNTDWNKLLEETTWVKATYQSLYGTGLCLGAYITLGSYNKRSNNLVGDSFLIVFVHIILTAFQVVTVAALLGHWLYLQKITDYTMFNPADIHEGFTWTLLKLLTVVSQFNIPQLWTSLLLFMLIFLFLNTLYVLTFNICSSIEDAIGDVTSKCLPRFGIAFGVSCFGVIVGLGYTTQSGSYAIELIERFLHLLCPWVILTFELMAIGWFYCAHLLARDVRQMIGRSCCWIWGYLVLDGLYIMPAVPVYLLVKLLGDYEFHKVMAGYDKEIADFGWTEPVGWVLTVVPILPIPLYMIFIITRTCVRGPGITYWEKFKYTLVSPLRYEIVKPTPPPRYSVTAPGYVLLPQAPLAEPEHFTENYNERLVRVSNI